MDLTKIVEYGVASLAVGGLIYITIQHIHVIRNHVSHSTRASQRLADMIEQMLKFLERRNGGK